MATDLPPQVEVIRLSKHFGEHDVQALADVSFAVPKGKFVALMGPSGCGKSTLLNCLAGIEKPGAGQIILDGQDIVPLGEAALTLLRRRKIGFVFQFFNLLSTLTVRENIELPLDLSGGMSRGDMRRRTDELLCDVGLSDRADFYPAQLSGGEMQRVAVLRAIIHSPEIVLADEPTGNLDTKNGVIVLEMLKRLCVERGETIVMATHSPEASAYADITVHMKDGRLIGGAGA